MTTLAPIVIFAYRRPDHLRNTLQSLMRCQGFGDSPVHVFCDGPKTVDETVVVEATRNLAHELLGANAEYHFEEQNQGLSRSIIGGVSQIVGRYGRVIVVEDDLELDPGFLTYMNRALDRYSGDDEVYQVSGYMFDLPDSGETTQAFFLPFTVSWGWATWERAWQQLDTEAGGWQKLKSDPALRRRFNINGAYDYATMLERQMQGLRDSWAIRWYWSVFKAQGLVLFPPVSFVSNFGFDGSGTHGSGLTRKFSQTRPASSNPDIELPGKVYFDEQRFTRVCRGIRQKHGGWIAAIVDLLRRILKR